MGSTTRRQAQRLFKTFSGLARRYQFRDREEICCHGISVSQCYTLEALAEGDGMTMGELAQHLRLEVSSVTRVVDNLVRLELVQRDADPQDRRVCRARLTPKGRKLIDTILGELVEVFESVLKSIAPGSREAVIKALDELSAAFHACDEKRCTAAREK